MPQAGQTTGPHLDIHLDGIGRPYQPGDIITGRVVRRTHAVSPQASVTIQLLGRAKTKIVVRRNNGNNTTHSYYRNRFNFFDAGYMHTKQQLHQGPIHVPSSSSPAAWEFALEIPTRASPRAVASELRDPEASYQPVDPGSIAQAPLPSSFATEGRHHNTRFEAYVEYHLEAALVQQGASSHHSSRHSDLTTATLPLHIRAAPVVPYPLTDFGLSRRSAPLAAASYRLVPGMEDAQLSFKQKSKKFFGSSSVPAFGFTLLYDCPSVIQLDNPAPIPLRMRAVPDARRTSEVLRGVPVPVLLTSLEMVLKADTNVIAPGTWGTHDGEGTVKHNVVLPVASAGAVPAEVLRTMGRGGGKEAANSGAVHRPASSGGADVKRRSLGHPSPPRDELGESSSSAAQGPAQQRSSKEEQAGGAGQGPETHDEPPPPAVGDSSSPPTYQPRDDNNDAPPPPPPAAQAEQPPAYQPAPAQSPAAAGPNGRGPLVVPSAWDDADGAETGAWIDVGAALGLRLHETHASCGGQPVARVAAEPVSPRFATYCIRHSHRLKWKIGLTVGGEKIDVEAEGFVEVVGASPGCG
ncbi:hypothetical protein KVR01_006383 [Diaporthe batatas]|uniref:uncharacterized protein n=1 Tax=Diaporthe batatas TaxID=748121 RepID=UPI001D059408|nr:uncharacterized protein KVR01_006383 [Diaporthe batatas]KAG8164465.1 hypothetical protein KVR01_006383 [Diaporthe batatas]